MLKIIGAALANRAVIKLLQSGSDLVISRHTELNANMFSSEIRQRANEAIKAAYVNSLNGEMTQEEAALLKLRLYYQSVTRHGDTRNAELLARAVYALCGACSTQIQPTWIMETYAGVPMPNSLPSLMPASAELPSAVIPPSAPTCERPDARPPSPSNPGGRIIIEQPTPAVSNQGRLIENVGIEVIGNRFESLIAAGCRVPCSVTQSFSTAENGQKEILISFYRGNIAFTDAAHFLGKFRLRLFPTEPAGQALVEVTLNIDAAAISATALNARTGVPMKIERAEDSEG